MEFLTANWTGQLRRQESGGREYLIAPVSLIVPGVLNGSRGPLFYPPDEVGRHPSIWNCMPITVRHPQRDGHHVSARSPDVLASQGVGTIYNARSNGKLTAEAWFDVERMRALDSRLLARIESGQPIELSTGLYTEDAPAENGAQHNGRAYTHVARNYRPDHVAILPDQKGACSIEDGCGVNVNAEESPKALLDKLADLYRQTANTLYGLFNFDPDQPRDERGRFGSGGQGFSQLIKKGSVEDLSTLKEQWRDKHGLSDLQETIVGHGLDSQTIGKTIEDRAKIDFDTAYDVSMEFASRLSLSPTSIGSIGDKSLFKRVAADHPYIVTENLSFNAQPHSKNTGRFKALGAGTGRGDIHEAAQRGSMMLTDMDVERGADAAQQADEGHNPPNWVVDEDIWERAKEAADKGDYSGDVYYAVVTHIYQNMGGSITSNEEEGTETSDILTNKEDQMPLTKTQRAELITNLLDCCWEEADRPTLEAMTDNQLTRLVAQAKESADLQMVANAARDTFGLKDLKLNEMPEAFKKAATAKDEGDDEEDEDEKKKAAPTGNVLTEEEWLAQAPAPVREDLAFARMEKAKQKAALIERLTANVAEDKRAAHANRLQSRSLSDLQADIDLLPPVPDRTVEPLANWAGAGGGGFSGASGKQQPELTRMGLPSEYLDLAKV